MRAGILIVYFSILASGCKSKTRIPGNILPQAKMQEVLWDMTRADLFLADFLLKKDSTLDQRTESIKLYQQVFRIHQISKEEFQQSLSFYKAHPVFFKPVLDSLSAHSHNAGAELIKPKLIKDTQSHSILWRPPGQDTILHKKRNIKRSIKPLIKYTP